MKIAITSDTHFGDGTSQLAALDSGGNPSLGLKYPEFREACGTKNDYLVMLGDVIDVAIKDYKDAYNVAKVFFKQVAKDEITKKILYVPGNHDYDLWHTVEYQTNIIKRITDKTKKDISLFKMSVPAVLDDRGGRVGPEIFLANVTRKPDAQKPYGGLFLDFLVDNELEFYVAFPNVYLITDREGCILMTHGQYFQQFWSLLSDYAPPIFGEKLNIGELPLTIKNLAHLNFPLSQLSSSGVGQAGPLSDVIRNIQYEFKAHKSETIVGYIDNLEKVLTKEAFKWYNPYHWGIKIGIYLAKKEIKKWIKKRPESSPRKDEEWEYKPDTHRKMIDFYKSSTLEIESLNKDDSRNIPSNPNMIIFGHSHRPIGIKEAGRLVIRPFEGQSLDVPVFNTGGWLEDENGGQKRFNGIEIFTYETGKGIDSVKI